MPLWVKKLSKQAADAGGVNAWVPAKKLWVKKLSKQAADAGGINAWTVVQKLWVKTRSGWIQFWPKSGPYPTTKPYFSTDSAGTNPDISYEYVGTTIYGQKGTWNANGYTLTSNPYSYQIWTYLSTTDSNPTKSTLTTYSSSVPITLSSATYDGKYISFYIQVNTTSGTIGADQSDLLFIRRQMPYLISNSFNTSTPTDGSTLTYSSTWNTTDLFLADSTRRKIEWYKSTNGSYTTTSAIRANATPIKTATNPSSSDLSVTVGSPSSDIGNYFYVIETQFNSGTDFINGSKTVGIENYLVSGIVINPAITQTAKPTISGSGLWNTSVVATSGTYSNYKSKTTGVFGILYPGGTAPIDGTSLTGGTVRSNSTTYTVTQADVTSPIYLLYAFDSVTGYDNVVKYYFSASYITPYVGTITDNFNRTVSDGLGTSSYGLQWFGLYNGSWSVNGSYAVSATSNPSGTPTNYPLYAMEMGGTTTRNMSVQFPLTSVNGLGLVWWLTDTGSWYASAVYQYKTSYTTYPCGSTVYGPYSGTCSNGAGNASGQICNCVNTTTYTYPCQGTIYTSGSPCTGGPGNGSGQVCNCTNYYSTSYACSNGPYTDSNSSCPADTGGAGSTCNCSVSSTTNTYYYCNGASGYLSSPCTATNPATAPYQNCYCSQTGTTSTTYSFVSGGSSYLYAPSVATTCTSSTIGYAQSGSVVHAGLYYYFNVCSSTTTTQYAYTYSSTSSYNVTNYTRTYKTRSSSPTTSFSYSQYQYTSVASNNSYTYSLTTTSTTNNYYTNLRIYSANGSSVTTLVDDNKNNSTSGYPIVWGMKTSTSGNTITSGIYSDVNLSNIIGSTSSYTPSSPIQADPTYGISGAGLFIGPSGDSTNTGSVFDNLSMS